MWLTPMIKDKKDKRYESVIQKEVIMFTLTVLASSSPESAFWFNIKARQQKINQNLHILLTYLY